MAFGEAGLASGGSDRMIKLWHLSDRTAPGTDKSTGKSTGKITGEIIGEHDNQVNSVAFSPDGKSLLSVGGDRTARIWPIAEDTPPVTFQGHGGEVLSAAWHPSGTQIASASRDKTVRLWQLPAPTSEQKLYSITFSPDSSLLAGATWEGSIELWKKRE